jgi:hypothetical protein
MAYEKKETLVGEMYEHAIALTLIENGERQKAL